MGLRISDEILEAVGRQVLSRDQQDGRAGDQPDRREIGGGVVERLLVEGLIDRMGAGGGEQELIAVRGRLHDPGGADHAAGAADVLDDHRDAQLLAQARPDDASQDIAAAAGRERNHHGDRPRWPILRHRRHGRERGDEGEQESVHEGGFGGDHPADPHCPSRHCHNRLRPQRCAQSAVMLAALMIGHHFSISAF
jgi:hypothetical protein